ncbi:MAG: hypothetical protein IKQ29_01215 [Bacilli bacterium]|nr:hypothetical protein [Bacilli bacterium]
MKENKTIEKFLDYYRDKNNEEYVYEKVYEKPNKVKFAIKFAICLFLLFLIIRFLLSPTLIFALVLIVDLLACAYYGYNLFSKKGFLIGKTVKFKKSELEELQKDQDLVYDEEDMNYQEDIDDEDDPEWKED